jgi:hypothetical protein
MCVWLYRVSLLLTEDGIEPKEWKLLKNHKMRTKGKLGSLGYIHQNVIVEVIGGKLLNHNLYNLSRNQLQFLEICCKKSQFYPGVLARISNSRGLIQQSPPFPISINNYCKKY